MVRNNLSEIYRLNLRSVESTDAGPPDKIDVPKKDMHAMLIYHPIWVIII